MLILVNENPRAGLSLHGPEENISSKDMDSLDFDLAKISATGINPDFICGIKAMCFSLVLYVAIAITGMFLHNEIFQIFALQLVFLNVRFIS